MIDENKNKSFIPIYNRIFKFDDNKLSPLQMFLYSYLFRSRLEFEEGWITYIHINLILTRLQCKVEGKGREKLDNIRSCLIVLQNKGYIFSKISSDTSFDALIRITFPTITDGLVDSKGYYSLPYFVFDKFEDKECLYAYCYLESNYNTEQKRHYKNRLSFFDWSKLLEVGKSTASNRIESMNNVNFYPRVWKISGDYVDGSEKQQENYYYTRPDDKVIFKWNNLYDENGKPKHVRKHKYSGEDTIISLYWGETTVDEFEEATEIANWGRVNDYFQEGFGEIKHVELEFDDYSIYKTCKEYNIFPKFIVKCENIMKAKKLTQNYDDCFEKWEKLYVYRICDDPVETDDIKEILEEIRQDDEKSKRRYSVPLTYNYDEESPF